MFTATNLLGDGLTTELGGEFIDTNHEEMLALMEEFGLERLDTRAPEAASLKPETYFINGRHYTQAQAARAFVPLAKRIFEDYDSLGDVVELQDRRRRRRVRPPDDRRSTSTRSARPAGCASCSTWPTSPSTASTPASSRRSTSSS